MPAYERRLRARRLQSSEKSVLFEKCRTFRPNDGKCLDYDLADEVACQHFGTRMKALGDPLRMTILDLVLERAMTVTELAARLRRPKGSVAYHVKVLVEAELLQVVRTQKVRAIEERYYGRVARTIVFDHGPGEVPFLEDMLAEDRPEPPGRQGHRRLHVPARRGSRANGSRSTSSGCSSSRSSSSTSRVPATSSTACTWACSRPTARSPRPAEEDTP